MVKFGKELERQMVQEWRSAYVNYKQLKRDIKFAKQQREMSPPMPDKWQHTPMTPMSILSHESTPRTPALARHLTQRLSRVKTLVSATGQTAASVLNAKPSSKGRRDVIKVNRTVGDEGEIYLTNVDSALHNVESARVFFARLDAEFNKVNEFYRKKEHEFLTHYEKLKKQLEALEEIRKILKSGCESDHAREEGANNFDKEGQPETIVEAVDIALERQKTRLKGGETLQPLDVGRTGGPRKLPLESDGDNHVHSGRSISNRSAASVEMASLDRKVTDSIQEEGSSHDGNSREEPSNRGQMRLKIPLSTPGTTIISLTRNLWEDLQKQGITKHGSQSKEEANFAVNKKNVNLAQKMLRTAFVEFYRGLTLLKNYRSLNMVAVSKILKKYDKVSGNRTLPLYLKAVQGSYLNTSDKVNTILLRVEARFAGAFAKNNAHKARLDLRPPEKRASHVTTFFLGAFTGGSLALIAVFAVFLEEVLPDYIPPLSDNLVPSPVHVPERIYIRTIFPVFSLSALIILHMYMYGLNLFYWRKWRINYAFMFDFKQGTELRHREVLMLASVLMTILLAAMVGHLALHSISSSPYIDLIPFGVFWLMVGMLLLPLKTFYFSSRIFLLATFFHLIMAPWYKVVLPDFFLGDQLTSQVPMLRNLHYVVCYYIGGFFRSSNADACLNGETFRGFTYLFALIPYWWRFLQCIRRVIQEGHMEQLSNAGKYFSAMLAVAFRIAYGRDNSLVWHVLMITASAVATVYQTYWDLIHDWGLLRRDSTNKWLRDNLIMPRSKYIYFLAMITNVLLRLAWLQSIVRFRLGLRDLQVADFFFAALEVIRRGMWNFFRLENEHLNNCGKYRAVKTVPLPFEDPMSQDY